jgi:riboflavin kinase/FMN adenylyltransferase
METIHLNRENLAAYQKKAKPNVMALGCFDGLHKGHAKVITAACDKAKALGVNLTVMSFFPHPKTVVTNGKKQIQYLMPTSVKAERLQSLGVDQFYIVEFDQEFAALPPDQFVAEYLIRLGVIHAVAGFDFCYGSYGNGNLDRLHTDSDGLIDVTKVAKVGYRGEKISSTLIRERLLAGRVDELHNFLGECYEIVCEWDGFILKQQPFYTLPAPGRYGTTVKNAVGSIKAEIVVTDNGTLTSLTDISSLVKGRLSIIWEFPIEISNNVKILIS